MRLKVDTKLIIPKNLNNWFKKLSKADKEDIYKYWLDKDNYFKVVKAPKFVDPIDYFKTLDLPTTISGM